MTIAAFTVVAKGWIKTLKRIKNKARNSPPARQLADRYYLGLPSAQSYDADDSGWSRIAPQATVGVPLDQVGKVLAAFDVSQGMYRSSSRRRSGRMPSPRLRRSFKKCSRCTHLVQAPRT